ncbi:DUF4760 domain-containing protein [Afifella aestuarii]|uniref:DUF4760 domain-containing protein n=1 Tax=Afifella aestuarii TaxID=1909496 RepID=UPI000FE33379|nr:hypothetical protein [Afifella aestuarii]
MTPHALLVACGVFVLMALAALFLASTSELSLVDVGVPVSLFSAVAGFLFNSAVKLHSEARDRAFDFLKEHSENDKLHAALARVGEFGRMHVNVTEAEAIRLVRQMIETKASPNALAGSEAKGMIDEGLLLAILRAGNFFEVMEIATRNGAVNEGIVRDYYREPLHRFHAIAAPIISVFRNSPPKPNSPYENVERPRALIGVDQLLGRWPLPVSPHPVSGRE